MKQPHSIISSRQGKLLKIISRQTLSKVDSDWVVRNLHPDMNPSVNIRRISQEGLAPFLYYHCNNLNILSYLPDSSKNLITRLYHETLIINSHIINTLEELGKILSRHGLRVIVLKGASLLNYTYKDIGVRPMEDIDLMVQPEYLKDLKRILLTIGFKPSPLYPNTFKKGIIYLDLHTDLISSHRIESRKELMGIQLEDMWQSAVLSKSYGSCIYRLSFYDNIIALAYHLLKHGYKRMIWFADIRELIESDERSFNWSEMIDCCRKVHSEKLLLYFLFLAKPLLGMQVAEKVLVALGKDDISWLERQILRLRLADEPSGMFTEILWLFQIKKTSQRIQFVKENIFPKKEVMRQIFPSSTSTFRSFIRRLIIILSNTLLELANAFRLIVIKGLPRI